MASLSQRRAFNAIATLFTAGGISERDFYLVGVLIGATVQEVKEEIACTRVIDGIVEGVRAH